MITVQPFWQPVVILTTILYISHFYILHFTHYIKKKSCWSLWIAEFCEKYRVLNCSDVKNGIFLFGQFHALELHFGLISSYWYHPYIFEHLSTIDSVNWLARNKMLHVSSINSLEHISLIFHGKTLLLFENVSDHFPETSKSVGLITSGIWPFGLVSTCSTDLPGSHEITC